jgi:hypothetical protein
MQEHIAPFAANFHCMSFDCESAPEPDVPNPTEQARVILEVCHYDISDARAIAARNVKFARTQEDIGYWSQVEQALTSKQGDLVASVFRLGSQTEE